MIIRDCILLSRTLFNSYCSLSLIICLYKILEVEGWSELKLAGQKYALDVNLCMKSVNDWEVDDALVLLSGSSILLVRCVWFGESNMSFLLMTLISCDVNPIDSMSLMNNRF